MSLVGAWRGGGKKRGPFPFSLSIIHSVSVVFFPSFFDLVLFMSFFNEFFYIENLAIFSEI